MKKKREGRFKLNMPFEEAVRQAVQVKLSAEGWGVQKQGKTIKAIRKILSAAASGSERRVSVELVE